MPTVHVRHACLDALPLCVKAVAVFARFVGQEPVTANEVARGLFSILPMPIMFI